MKKEYTKKQGQYLSFIYYYRKLNKVAPAHADFQKYFEADPASVNNMLKTLEKKDLSENRMENPEVLNYYLTEMSCLI